MYQSYYEDKSINYGIAHTRLKKILQLAGRVQGKRVLDIGCATGYIGRCFKEQGNYVVGIEISHAAAKKAEEFLDLVYSFDLQASWPEEICSQGFDLIIIAEVTEHVFDPVQLLKEVRKVLNDGGDIIITTPNFLTWTNRLKMLFGLFRYTEQGLLDFGHIRFFTYRYLKQVLTEAGFNVIKERHIIFPGKLTRILKYWPSLFATQFIIKVRRL